MVKTHKVNIFDEEVEIKIDPELNKDKDHPFFQRKLAEAEQRLKELGGGDINEAFKKIEEAFAKAEKQNKEIR